MTTPSSPETLVDLSRLAAGIRWRRRTWLGTALVGLLLAMLVTIVLPPAPTAVTRVLVAHEQESDGALATDIALLETTRIAEAVVARIGSRERPEDFLRTFSAEALTRNVIEITVAGATREDAVRRAQALVDVFVTDHVERAEAVADAEATALLDRREQAERDLEAVNARIARADPADDPEALFGERATLVGQIQSLGRQAEEAGSGAPRIAAGTQIVDPPRPVGGALRAAVTTVLVGLILGLGLGLGLAALATVVGDRPVLRRDIADALGASVIAQIRARPRSALRRRRSADRERKRVAAVIERATRGGGSVALLALGCGPTAAALAGEVAALSAAEGGPVVLLDGLAPGVLGKAVGEPTGFVVRDCAETPQVGPPAAGERRIGVGSVDPGAAWTGLTGLGGEAVLVVRAGSASTAWLHTVARQLADLEIVVLGVVLVHPDPRDRSDGTLWSALNVALRGRVGLTAPEPAQPSVAPPPDAPVGALDRALPVNGHRSAAATPTGSNGSGGRPDRPRFHPIPVTPWAGGVPDAAVRGPLGRLDAAVALPAVTRPAVTQPAVESVEAVAQAPAAPQPAPGSPMPPPAPEAPAAQQAPSPPTRPEPPEGSEPARPEPARPEPAEPESAVPESAVPEPADSEPADSGPGPAGAEDHLARPNGEPGAAAAEALPEPAAGPEPAAPDRRAIGSLSGARLFSPAPRRPSPRPRASAHPLTATVDSATTRLAAVASAAPHDPVDGHPTDKLPAKGPTPPPSEAENR